jgi:hypothetical protein
VVREGGVPLLADKLKEIEYIDLAEQVKLNPSWNIIFEEKPIHINHTCNIIRF